MSGARNRKCTQSCRDLNGRSNLNPSELYFRERGLRGKATGLI